MNKDTYIVTEAEPFIILYSKFAVCMAKNGKDTKHNRYIARRVHLVRNGEECKMYKFVWWEGDLKLADIATKNDGEKDLNSRIEYIIVMLDNWESDRIVIKGKS